MSEIRFELAKNSEMIFTVDGRHLCSAVDPSHEAKQWVSNHKTRISGAETILIVGVGCGYHIREMKKIVHPRRLIGIDAEQSILDATMRAHSLDLYQDDLILFAPAHPVLAESVRQPFSVLLHEPSGFANPKLNEIRNFILGRTITGLPWLFRNRGWSAPRPQCPVNRLLSLKNLDDYLQTESTAQPWLRALRELIV